jgi:hypothetical protein
MSTLNSIPFTAAGNLTADPELWFTGTGKPATGLRIAVTPRRFDRDSNSYMDGVQAGVFFDRLRDFFAGSGAGSGADAGVSAGPGDWSRFPYAARTAREIRPRSETRCPLARAHSRIATVCSRSPAGRDNPGGRRRPVLTVPRRAAAT